MSRGNAGHFFVHPHHEDAVFSEGCQKILTNKNPPLNYLAGGFRLTRKQRAYPYAHDAKNIPAPIHAIHPSQFITVPFASESGIKIPAPKKKSARNAKGRNPRIFMASILRLLYEILVERAYEN